MIGRSLAPILILFILLAGATRSASAQVTPSAPDSVAPADPPETGQVLEFSPRGAFLRSLVLPGWGQAYVGAPGRGVVYFSMASGSVWMAYVSRRQLNEARREQFWLRESGVIGPTDETGIALARADQFEDWAALSVFLFFFAGADAYVAAHLIDFDERIGIQPGADGSLQIRASIPTGWPR